jgi:hypothetical protein
LDCFWPVLLVTVLWPEFWRLAGPAFAAVGVIGLQDCCCPPPRLLRCLGFDALCFGTCCRDLQLQQLARVSGLTALLLPPPTVFFSCLGFGFAALWNCAGVCCSCSCWNAAPVHPCRQTAAVHPCAATQSGPSPLWMWTSESACSSQHIYFTLQLACRQHSTVLIGLRLEQFSLCVV